MSRLDSYKHAAMEDFGKVARKAVLTAVLTVGTALSLRGQDHAPLPVTPDTPQTSAAVKAIMNDVGNKALLRDSMLNFRSFFELSGGAEEDYLNKLRVDTENASTTPEGFGRSVFVPRVIFYDLSQALNIPYSDMFAAEFKHRMHVEYTNDVSNLITKASENNRVKTDNQSMLTFTNPFASVVTDKEGYDVSILMPSTYYYSVQDQIAVTAMEARTYTDAHEKWHIISYNYGFCEKMEQNAKAQDPAFFEERPQYVGEVFADLGALGEMVEKGHSLTILQKLADWREQNTKTENPDHEHMSKKQILMLYDSIFDMGIEKFRHLPMLQKVILYQNIMDKAGFERPVAEAGALQRPPGLTAAQQTEVAHNLKGFDAQKVLIDKAFELGGKATPLTIFQAYNDFQSRFSETMRNSSDPVNSATVIEIQAALQKEFHQMAKIDFIKINADRGVDLFKTEPALIKIAEGPVKTASYAAPAQGG